MPCTQWCGVSDNEASVESMLVEWIERLFGRSQTAVSRCRRESSKAISASEAANRKLQSSTIALEQAAATQEQAYRRLEQQYLAKVQELQQCDCQLQEMATTGYTSTTHQLVSRIRQLEATVPKLKAAVEAAEQEWHAMQRTLHQLRHKLQRYHNELEQLQQLRIFNQAKAAHLDSHSALAQAGDCLLNAQQTLESQQDELSALAKLSHRDIALLAEFERLEHHIDLHQQRF